MRNEQRDVREFMAIKGYMPDPPTTPTAIDIKLAEQRHDFLMEENDEYLNAVLAGDLTAIADALADALYIVLGTAVAHGIDLQPIFEAVHRSNMTKSPVSLTGKGDKGPNYVPPTAEIASLLLAQITGLEDTPTLAEHEHHARNVAWEDHLNACVACQQHADHAPFGLCDEGRTLFFDANA